MTKFCMGCMNKKEIQNEICPSCGYLEGTKPQEALHMEPSNILHDRYIIGQALGFGGFGVTYIAWDALLEQKVAIKEYLPSEFATRIPGHTQITVYTGDKNKQFKDGLDKFLDEAKRLAKFHQQEGIVRIFDSFEANNTAYIVMEYLQGETLAQCLKRRKTIPADEAIALLLPVIQSLEAVHDKGILHRDIAPDNIFLTSDGRVKLIDFGAARFATTSYSRSLTVIIKPGYSPEEQYRSRGDQGPYTDVYAISATLYRMVTGNTPPDALERRAYFENKKKDILKPPGRHAKNLTQNQETAMLNALNVRVADRTPDMTTLEKELTTEAPEKVTRLYGKIKKVDLLRWPLWAKILTPLAVLALVALGALFALGITGTGPALELQEDIYIGQGMSRVPSVINSDIYQAEERLATATLLIVVSGREYSDIMLPNLVLTQNINAGTVVVYNTIIEVKISAAQQIIVDGVVPNVLFMTETEAVQAIEAAGLVISATHEYSDTVAYGLVITQSPAEGAVLEIGGAVDIVISLGSQDFPMPDVVGMDEAFARDLLVEYGLVVEVVHYEYGGDIPAGYVMLQGIEPGTLVSRGDSLGITVAVDNGYYADMMRPDDEDAIDVPYPPPLPPGDTVAPPSALPTPTPPAAQTPPTTGSEPGRPPGLGTEASPFLISEPAHLTWINENRAVALWPRNYFRLTTDIIAPANLVIGGECDTHFQSSFGGNFDGNGHSITIDINVNVTSRVGLFAENTGVIRNLTVNGNVRHTTTWHYTSTGGITGSNSGGRIENSISNANVSGNVFVGGLVGSNNSTILNSSATGNVTGNNVVGGLVGRNFFGPIRNSTASGNVTGSNRVGGLVGENEGSQGESRVYWGVISGSSASGNVTGVSMVGGFVGWSKFSDITSSAATGTVTGITDTGNFSGREE